MNGHDELDFDDSDFLETEEILSIICNTSHDILGIDTEEFKEDARQAGDGQTGDRQAGDGQTGDRQAGGVQAGGVQSGGVQAGDIQSGQYGILAEQTHMGELTTPDGQIKLLTGHPDPHTDQPNPQPVLHHGVQPGSTTSHKTVPCPICTELTTNHQHYGGVSCISCKAFFRRAVTNKEKKEDRCRGGNGSCNLTLERRNNCPSCRFQSCLSTGMQADLVLSGKAAALKHTSLQKKRKRKSSEETPTRHNNALPDIMEKNRLIISRVPSVNLFTVETDVIDEIDKRLMAVQLDPGSTNQDVIFVAQLEHALLVAKQCVAFFTEHFTLEKILQSKEEGFCPAFIFTSVQEYFVQLVVLFLKSCSHFQSLTWSCQARLLRKNLADVFILLITMCFDKEKQVFRWGLGGRDLDTIKQWSGGGISQVVEIDKVTLARYTTNKIGEDIFQVVNFLVDMELPNHILMILMLIIIFARDGMMMEKQHKVDLARSFYLKLLYRYVKTTNPSHQASTFTASLHRALKTVKDVAEKIKAYEVVSAQRFVTKT